MSPRTLLAVVLCFAGTARAEWKRLYADHADATSFLKSNWNKFEENYHPNYALDDDPKTAWVEGVDGEGVGEKLTIPLSALGSARAVRLVIFNGYQKSPALLAANGAPKVLDVTVSRDHAQTGSARLELTRKQGPQSFDIPLHGGVSTITLSIGEVHPGAAYQDTCLSDVQVFVDSDVPYNATVENKKRDLLLAWRKERIKRAAWFAKLPKKYPYVSTRFIRQEVQVDEDQRCAPGTGGNNDKDCVKRPKWRTLDERLEQDGAGFIPAQVALVGEVQALARARPATMQPADLHWYSFTPARGVLEPDGLDQNPLVAALFHVGDATLFEAASVWSTRSDADGNARSNLALLEGTPAKPRRAFFTVVEASMGRTVVTTDHHTVITWDEQGLLEDMVTFTSLDGYQQGRSFTALHAEKKDGRVTSLSFVDVSEMTSGPGDQGVFTTRGVFRADK
jgi:hypothetical protein